METKHLTSVAELKEIGDQPGYLEAVISTFDVIDSDGDVVLASAFTPGQEVPLVWSHNWDMPIGKGVIAIEGDRALFKGQLWLDTFDGEQAYRKIKNAGSLQEYSWGFRILDADYAERDGRQVRIIKGTEMFEASPTLVGANRDTHTRAIKSLSSFEAEADLLGEALAAYNQRAKARAEMRQAKDGRVLSAANRERLTAHLAALRQAGDDIEAILAATAPQPTDADKAAVLAVVISAQKTLARLNGVAV